MKDPTPWVFYGLLVEPTSSADEARPQVADGESFIFAADDLTRQQTRAWGEFVARQMVREAAESAEELAQSAPRNPEEFDRAKSAVMDKAHRAERFARDVGALYVAHSAGDVAHRAQRVRADWLIGKKAWLFIDRAFKNPANASLVMSAHHHSTLERIKRFGWWGRGHTTPRGDRAWATFARMAGFTKAPAKDILDVAYNVGDIQEFQPNGEIRVIVRQCPEGMSVHEYVAQMRRGQRIGRSGRWRVTGKRHRDATVWLRWR